LVATTDSKDQKDPRPLPPPVAQDQFLEDLLRGWSEEFGEPSLGHVPAKAKSSPKALTQNDGASDSGLRTLAVVQGPEGRMHVFNRGRVFIPKMVPSRFLSDDIAAPLIMLPLEDVAEARRILLKDASSQDTYAMQIFVPNGQGGKNLQLEIRSEFPVRQCSATSKGVTFESSFGYDGWTSIIIRRALEKPPPKDAGAPDSSLLVGCLIDGKHPNPMPKRKVTEAPLVSAADLSVVQRKPAKPSRPVSVTVRVTIDGDRLPVSSFVLGPYQEPADQFWHDDTAGQKTQFSFDLKADVGRLLALWFSQRPKGPALWLSSGAEADWWQTEAASQQDWSLEVENFLLRRESIAEKVRKNAL
jgi:hypothetical protein